MKEDQNATQVVPELLSVREARNLLGVKSHTVRVWVSKGKIPFVRLGPRTIGLYRADVENLAARRLSGSATLPLSELMTVSQAARQLAVSVSMIYRWASKARVRSAYLDGLGMMVSRADIEKILSEALVEARQPEVKNEHEQR